MYIDPYYLVLVVPALIMAIWAQFKVTSAFNLYKIHRVANGMTAEAAARRILDENGLSFVEIRRIPGKLTDNFNPRTNTVSLSQEVYGSDSISAIGIAAHEVGHAIQYNINYLPMKVRGFLLPVANIGSNLAIPLALFGFMSGYSFFVTIGIIAFCATILFQIVTLPIEYNASARALQTVIDYNILTEEERTGAEKVLTASALTYVAGVFVSLMNLMRLLLIRRNNDK